jgi:hypothetical protein
VRVEGGVGGRGEGTGQVDQRWRLGGTRGHGDSPVPFPRCQRPAWCGAVAAECEALLARCAVERLLEALRRDSLSPYKRLWARGCEGCEEARPPTYPTLAHALACLLHPPPLLYTL